MASYSPKRGAFKGEEFGSYRQYRNALARKKGLQSWYEQQRVSRSVRNSRELASLHPEEREARRAAFDALNLMRREGLSLKQAAARGNTTPAAVLRHTGPALERQGGRYRALPGDRLLRSMTVFGQHGVEHQVEVRGSRSASLVGEHWAAVRHYLLTGDTARLEALEGKSVAGIPLETDPYVIDEWERRGELEIEDIYDLTS